MERNLVEVATYPLEEICAEKLRTLLQRTEPRDLYDVWRLMDEHANEMDAQRLRTTFEAKCAHRGLTASSAAILSAERVTKYRAAWERRLSEQVPDLPALDAVARQTRRKLREFFG